MAAPPTVPSLDRDERLARVLAELSDQARAGRLPDLDAAVAGNPDLGDELRSLWAAAQLAEEFTRSKPVTAVPDSAADLRAAGLAERLTLSTAAPPAAAQPPRSFGDYELLEEVG